MSPSSSSAVIEPVHELTTEVAGRPARVFVGGRGAPLLLVHGGWGGARLHWSSVWTPLAEHFRVVAPDLPGIGRVDQPGLGSLGAYARWIGALLDAVGVDRAWCVGNSFGASVVSRFALDAPARCLGLVLVNGFPMPATPPLLRRLGARAFAERVIKAVQRRVAYTPRAVARAFSDPSHVPDELRALVRQRAPAQLDAFAPVLIAGGDRAMPPFAPLLLWGADDRLPGTSGERSARKLVAKWPGAELALVPKAGHMPQVENPAVFVGALEHFVAARGAA